MAFLKATPSYRIPHPAPPLPLRQIIGLLHAFETLVLMKLFSLLQAVGTMGDVCNCKQIWERG